GDATGNVHIFYSDEMLVGDKAHYDGVRTITVTGHPYIVNKAQDSILHADVVTFDTVDQVATLTKGRGESTEGVEKGEVYFSAKDLKTTSDGVAHGNYAYITTCAHPRGGYHITGRTLDVKPGDRITITKAVLFLGALAVFYLPKVVIPLRQVDDERKKPSFFPEVGYNSYQGAYIKVHYPFGKDDYYYGYYILEYYTKVGFAFGYSGSRTAHNGRRQSNLYFYETNDRRVNQRSYNINGSDVENLTRTLRANLAFAYNGNYGPFTNIPASTNLSANLAHSGLRESQTYQYSRSAIGSQSSTNDFAFTDTRTLRTNLTQAFNYSLTQSQSNFGTLDSSTTTGHVTTQTHLTTLKDDYLLTFDKTFTSSPYGINKLPELLITPYAFFPHFVFPISARFAIGEYNEPQNSFSTSRADATFNLTPPPLKIYGSDFDANFMVRQDAYGTGDLKAQITQNMSLNTPIGHHMVNSLSYNETNNNGPAFAPFQTFDTLPTTNTKNAQDVLRIFNKDVYSLALSTGTSFNMMAQPVSYQLTARPSARSLLILGGSFTPGVGQGFYSTNLQVATPFGRDADLQFVADIDWKNKGRVINKNIFYHKIIGDCYEIRVQYNENLKQVNVTLNLLAFPSRGANFGINKQGPIIPTSFNP
ncbi:MAG: hypothetical protein ABI182_08715, partial [Candidatus Baltobacteraceae bacterium]